MPDWLAPIIAFFVKLFSPSRPADSSHNQFAQTRDVGTLIQAQEGSQVNVNTPQKQPPEPAFSEIEKDILRAVELNTIFTVFRHPKESQVLIKVRVAGKKTAMFHFPDDPIKNLAYVEELECLCDRGYFSQQAESASFTDTYRPTIKGHEAAQELQADSSPSQPPRLPSEEHELLSLIEPGGYFMLSKGVRTHIYYYDPGGHPVELSYSTERNEALESLVERGLINNKRKWKYTLTDAGIKFKKTMPPPSD